jgi:hypothetical protein
VLPHQPPAEQQLPKVEPAQVNLFVPPQVPSVETVAAVGVLEALVVVVEDALAVVEEAAEVPVHPDPKAD